VAGIISQRLVRKVCLACLGKKDNPSNHRRSLIGCKLCGYTGYKGRTGIFEVFSITPMIRELISSKSPESVLRTAAENQGLKSLLHDALDKIRMGITTKEEVYRVVETQDINLYDCPNCGNSISADYVLCPHCGLKQRTCCVSCHNPTKADWIQCPYCGATL